MLSNTNSVTPSSERLFGRVKWFNNKAGYGFITISDDKHSNTDDVDFFVHHSAIDVENQQYKYLIQGEYVEFSLAKTTSGKHEFQASNVHGINKGKLMCETRNELKLARTNYKTDTNFNPQHSLKQTPQQPNKSVKNLNKSFKNENQKGKEKQIWTLVGNSSKEHSDLKTNKKVNTLPLQQRQPYNVVTQPMM